MRPFRTSFDIFIEISPKVKKLGLYEPLCYATFGPSHVQLAIFFKLMVEKVSIACIGNFLSPLKAVLLISCFFCIYEYTLNRFFMFRIYRF